jgi:hypothetical protein
MLNLKVTFLLILADLLVVFLLFYLVDLCPRRTTDKASWKRTKKRVFWIFVSFGPLVGCITMVLTSWTVLVATALYQGSDLHSEISETLGILVYMLYFALFALPFGIPMAYATGLIPATITACCVMIWYSYRGTMPAFAPLSIALLMATLTVCLLTDQLVRSIFPGQLLPKKLISYPIIALTHCLPAYVCWRSTRWIY